MTLVLDASVTLKWFLPEDDGAPALELLRAGRSGLLSCLQPPHWRVEVAAVLAREQPASAAEDLRLLHALAFVQVQDRPEVLERAVQLSAALGHHLFDTMYHALALTAKATLVTADRRYFRAAQPLGAIELLERSERLFSGR